MAKNVKFNRLKNKAFAIGSSKDADTIYFTTDTREVILGGQVYGCAVPKVKHELIYSDDNATLTTKQLLYDGGVIVDNPTDLARCKNNNDFTIQEIGTTWPTEVISAWTSGISSESKLEPGHINDPDESFWYYNQQEYTIDAKFNDDTYSRSAHLYNPDTPANVTHDALYGFYASDPTNDGVGCGFISFGTQTTTDSTGTWCPTVRITMDGGVRMKGSSSYNPMQGLTLGIGIYKRRASWTDKRVKYFASGNSIVSVPGFGIIGSQDSTKVSGTSVETGKCIVKNTELISCPWSTSTKKCGPAFIRIRTEKVGNVITWYFSEIVDGNITDLESQTPELKKGSKVQLDMDRYIVRYITPSMNNWSEYSCADFSTYIDVIKNDAHFCFWQFSTPKGRIYNVTHSDHQKILDIDTDQVWQRNGDTWSIISGTTPLDLFTGSRISYNDTTKKLWYSTGTNIREIGGSTEGLEGYWTYENGNIYANNHKIITVTPADTTAAGRSFDQSIFSNNGGGYNALHIRNNVTESEWVGYTAGINLESKRTFAHDDVTYNIGAGIELGSTSVTSGGVTSGVSSYIDFKLGHAEFSDELSDYTSAMKLGHRYYQGGEDYTMNLGGLDDFKITSQHDENSNSWVTLRVGESNTRILMGEYVHDGSSNINYYVGNGISYGHPFGTHNFNSDIIITPESGSGKTGKVEAPGGFFQTSDIRKKNVLGELDLNKAYDLIDKCQTIIYSLKDNPDRVDIGLIAQEVYQFFPEIVSEDKDGMLSLDYAKLTVIILRVLKDLIARVSKLESK